ncbi:CdiA C-terminal domain-containing protein [Lactovum odontotermitis]
MSKEKRIGDLKLSAGRFPEKHELEVGMLFVQLGHDVLFLPESQTKGQRTADIEMDGLEWEIKSPTGKGKQVVEKQFRRAKGQSVNLILDSRRCPFSDDAFLKMVQKQWETKRVVKRLTVITKENGLLDFRR